MIRMIPTLFRGLTTRSRALQREKQLVSVAARRHSRKSSLAGVPDLRSFMQRIAVPQDPSESATDRSQVGPDVYVDPASLGGNPLASSAETSEGGTFYLETVGCQMNESDSEIVHSVLAQRGYSRVSTIEEADVILTNTCSIREGAEVKVWNRLAHFAQLKRARAAVSGKPVVIGVLGCMAERLKTKLLDSDRLVDVVAGPDAYRDLPRLIHTVRAGEAEHGINVQLSQDETYADIAPVRSDGRRISSFVSIMRGCSNMCAFCVVPFTRGRERSRDAVTIVDEVRRLADEGYREVTLLGQNVNSYHDAAGEAQGRYAGSGYVTAAGFSNMMKLRDGPGIRFTELLDRVSLAVPGMRIRFTSPHPKDFPDDLLHLIAERDNLCKQLHLPAQSGSTRVLASMRRGYTREAYLQLIERVRTVVPGVALSTDIIAGFCAETEEDHADTVSLMRTVRYDHAFMFAYSLRERTHAAYKLKDDVPEEVKFRRLHEVIAAFREGAAQSMASDLGSTQLVLVEGPARKSTPEAPLFSGRTDTNKRCVFPVTPVAPSLASGSVDTDGAARVDFRPGDFIAVRINGAGQTSLRGTPLARTSLQEFSAAAASSVSLPWRRRSALSTPDA